MIRLTFCLLFVSITVVSFSQENSVNFKRKLQASASISLNSNGIAPVPAFSLEKPAIISSISFVKGRFSYEPALAYGLDFRPWYIDNWIRYKVIVRPALELRAGVNISSYFTGYTPSEELIWQCERYFTFEVAGMRKLSTVSSLSLIYWNDRGQETVSMKGHYLSLTWDRSEIKIENKVQLNLNVQLYYINYDGNNDGVFISPKVSSTVTDLPFSLFLQANQALQSNIVPFPKFKWNIGISYSL